MKKIICILFLIVLNNYSNNLQRGVIITSVADCLGESIADIQKKNPTTSYDNIALCTNGPSQICPRIHQVLYNKCVFIVQETDKEVKIQIPDIFFQRKGNRVHHNMFWIAKKNIIPLETLKLHGITEQYLPCESHKDYSSLKKIVTLIKPFSDQKTGLNFCVGTRFVVKTEDKDIMRVYAFDPHKLTLITLEIPKNLTLIMHPQTTPVQKIRCMINLLQSWAHHTPGRIPYVWGGCSIRQFCRLPFEEHENMEDSITYVRKDLSYPYTGVDCTGVITLAAQICGLPYYFKNSITVAQNLASLQSHEAIEVGDIIWIPGHVMIISNLAKNLIIEARHYSQGYGILHEIPLPELFKGINTFSDLKKAYMNQEPLDRLDSNGEIAQTINKFNILRLKSIWKKSFW